MEHDLDSSASRRAFATVGFGWLWLALVACGGPSDGESPAADPESPFVPAPNRVAQLEIAAVDKIDVLFVIDRSGSMRDEQQALGEQFPRLARALASGDVDGDGEPDFPPPRDVQFGVISSEMGLFGIANIENCDGLGDDGLLLPASRAAGSARPGCPSELPAFVRYRAEESDVEQVAREFACLATLGTDGCGFEHPLEATLKALWPNDDDRVVFRGADDASMRGHGGAQNAGFSRAAPGTVPSLLVIVMIADEDDCSAADPSLFDPSPPPGDPLATQDINLRCFRNPDNLYPIERYASGLKLLREGAEQLVMFAAIVGVPEDRIDRSASSGLESADADTRAAFYRDLLDDPRMQERVDPDRTPEQGGSLSTVCESDNARAYPARRIVQVAQSFGENGVVQSICQEDFTDMLSFILERIAHRMRNPS
jgi:hypothetical protein